MDAANKCSENGKDVKFTCTASFPDSISNGPSVTWHKVSDSGDTLVEVQLASCHLFVTATLFVADPCLIYLGYLDDSATNLVT